MNDTSRTARSEGQVFYALNLHLDSVDLGRRCHCERHRSENFRYSVEGKPRPTLVLGPNGEKMRGIQWDWVLKLTSGHNDRDPVQSRGYVRLGDILGDGTVSYADRRLYSIPENLFEDEVKAALGRESLQSVLSIVTRTPGRQLR